MRQTEIIALIFSFFVFITMASGSKRAQTTAALGSQFRFNERGKLPIPLLKGCWLLIVALFCIALNGCVVHPTLVPPPPRAGSLSIAGDPFDSPCNYKIFLPPYGKQVLTITVYWAGNPTTVYWTKTYSSVKSDKYAIQVPSMDSFRVHVDVSETDSHTCYRCSGAMPKQKLSWSGEQTFELLQSYNVIVSCNCPI
jgi:hypothetical protein